MLMIGRAAATAAPLEHLAMQRHLVRDEAAAYFAALVTSLRDRTSPPTDAAITEPLRAYLGEVERLRSTDALRMLTAPQMARLDAMGFALEQLSRDHGQLHDRVAERDDAAAPSSRSNL